MIPHFLLAPTGWSDTPPDTDAHIPPPVESSPAHLVRRLPAVVHRKPKTVPATGLEMFLVRERRDCGHRVHSTSELLTHRVVPASKALYPPAPGGCPQPHPSMHDLDPATLKQMTRPLARDADVRRGPPSIALVATALG